MPVASAVVAYGHDAAFPVDGPSRSDAARLLMDAAPIEVGDWSELKAEIEQMYAAEE